MLNICGCLVHTVPATTNRVAAMIAATDGCDVHAISDGRIVVTVEDTAEMRASETIMAMHQIAGVLTVTLTYHHFEQIDPAEVVAPAV